MNQIRVACFTLIVAVMLGICGMFPSCAAWADDDSGAGYGPDWPICRNLQLDPSQRLQACDRLLQSDKLSKKHLSWTYNNRGTAWRDIGNLKNALADFEKAIEVDPTNGSPYFNRGWNEHEAGDDAKAIEDMRTAIRLKPQDTDFYCYLGQILEGSQRFDEALVNYEAGLRIAPTNVCLLSSHANVLDQLERYQDAAADFSKVIKLTPTDRFGWVRRALDYIDLGANKAAISDASAALQLNPDDIDALSARGEAYFRDRQYDKARLDCERLLAMRPGDLSCTDFDIRALMLQGQFQEAVGKAGESADVQGQPHFILAKAIAEYALGSYDQAAQDFTAAADADPEDPYRALFKYLADRRLGHDDKGRLADLAERNDIWPTPLAQYVTGHLSKDELFAAADVPDPDIKKQRLAEANFYLGELAALDGHADVAAQFFKDSVSIGEVRIGERRHMALYKDHDDYEISLARAALRGNAL
ncbi:MAG TPA: tetratricopeptide repeat protein [Dongiaceae bacterium]|nr:tetratricopeptide repeat protein [Dongiaceae bacterium]